MLYLPLKCKSAAIRLAHSVAMGNKMYSRIKTFVEYNNSSEKSKMTYSEDKRKETIRSEKSIDTIANLIAKF